MLGPGPSSVSDQSPSKKSRSGCYFLIFFVVVLVLVIDAVYVGVKLGTNLVTAADKLQQTKDLIADGRINEARAAAEAALDSSGKAAELSWHPSFVIGRFLPWVRDDARAVNDMASAAKEASGAATQAVTLVDQITLEGGQPGSRLYDGGVKLDVVRAVQPLVEKIDLQVKKSLETLNGAPDPHLTFVQAKLEEARSSLKEASSSLEKGREALAVLPGLLGGDGTRRYFLAFQSPSEARGTGGLIGTYGILVAEDGRLRVQKVARIGSLPLPPKRAAAPRWYAVHYGALGGQKFWQQTNISPDFPVVARVWLDMYRQVKGTELDGVMALDPYVLQELLKATGPVEAPGLGTLDGTNAAEKILHDSYELPALRQDHALAVLLKRTFSKLSTGNVDTTELINGVSRSTTSERLKIYSDSSTTQERLEALGIDGWSRDPHLQLVWHTSASVSKVDYFLKRRLDIEVDLESDGSAQVTTTAHIRNEAADDGSSALTRSGYPGDPRGLNRMYLNYLLPQEAHLQSFQVDGRRKIPLRNREGAYPVFWDVLRVLPGDSARVEVAYRLPPAAGPSNFFLTLQPQGTVTPDDYSVTISPPPGFEIVGSEGGDFRQEGLLDREIPLRVDLSEAG